MLLLTEVIAHSAVVQVSVTVVLVEDCVLWIVCVKMSNLEQPVLQVFYCREVRVYQVSLPYVSVELMWLYPVVLVPSVLQWFVEVQ